jgi:hypothetical protein
MRSGRHAYKGQLVSNSYRHYSLDQEGYIFADLRTNRRQIVLMETKFPQDITSYQSSYCVCAPAPESSFRQDRLDQLETSYWLDARLARQNLSSLDYEVSPVGRYYIAPFTVDCHY